MMNINDVERIYKDQEEQDVYEQVARIDKILIGHQFFISAIEGIQHCIKSSVYAREPVNCMLLGNGGMGKTTLATVIMESMKPKVIIENDLNIQTVPAFYTSFKSARTLDALTTDILKKLHDPHPTVGKVGDKGSRALELLIQCRTSIVFIDEVHDLDGFKKKDYEKMDKFFTWIKEICNRRGPAVCLMGVPTCHDVFDNDPQMARRFKHKLFLHPLTPGTKEKPGLLPGFLEAIVQQISACIPGLSFPKVHEYMFSVRIFAATGGNLDFILPLLKEVVFRALIEKRATIEAKDFVDVWASGILSASSMVGFNPFDAPENQLASAFRNQKR